MCRVQRSYTPNGPLHWVHRAKLCISGMTTGNNWSKMVLDGEFQVSHRINIRCILLELSPTMAVREGWSEM